MRKADVEIGATYLAKVSSRIVRVKILRTSPYGGWVALNLQTSREVHVKTAGRLTPESFRPDHDKAMEILAAKWAEQDAKGEHRDIRIKEES